MFGPEAPPLPWDSRNEYSRGSIELYYLSHAGEESYRPCNCLDKMHSDVRCLTLLHCIIFPLWFAPSVHRLLDVLQSKPCPASCCCQAGLWTGFSWS